MELSSAFPARKGARSLTGVTADILAQLGQGTAETVNLMEWLAADMATLARSTASTLRRQSMREALLEGANRLSGMGVVSRLRTMGAAICSADPEVSSPDFQAMAAHQSDIVRQWACFAVNDARARLTFARRLGRTRTFSADRNMTVREASWMAFRPHLIANLKEGLAMLECYSREPDANVRRFSIEVSRPRSVWGAHIAALKKEPDMAVRLLENTRADPARYVQLAVGNWLNDASKTRPDWVKRLCKNWAKADNRHTEFIVRRGMRTLTSQRRGKSSPVTQLAQRRVGHA